MARQSIIMECSFSHNLKKMGCMYIRPANTPPLIDPDLYFFCLYVCRLLTEKKIGITDVLTLQKQLALGAELMDFCKDPSAEGSPLEMEITPAGNIGQMTFSASLLLRKDRCSFRWGYIGFGYFLGRRKLVVCATQSVYGLLHTMYHIFKEDAQKTDRLWRACAALGTTQIGAVLNRGNFRETAEQVCKNILGGECFSDGQKEA